MSSVTRSLPHVTRSLPRVMLSLSKHARATSRALAAAVLLCATAAPAFAQDAPRQQALDAMKKLSFLDGTWNCVMHGGASNGLADKLTYSFAADGRWLIERSDIQGVPAQSSVQIWGYDPAQRGLVAYQYSQAGIATKTVAGWQGDAFVSTRNDNGATVSLKQTGPNAISWIIHPAGTPSQDVTEDCTR